MIKEAWKDIPGYEGRFRVSDQGRIFSYKTDRILNYKPAKNGYLCVTIRDNGKPSYKTIHRLVMLAFIGPSELYVNHINGIKTDNRIENLEYVSQRENSTHGKRTCKPRKYKFGVIKDKTRSKFKAQIKIKGSLRYLGTFYTEDEAHNAYCDALKEYNVNNKYVKY